MDPLQYDVIDLDLNYKGAPILGRPVGIAGLVQIARHKPGEGLLAVKRYNLERKKEERSEEENSEAADFHELVKSIQVNNNMCLSCF